MTTSVKYRLEGSPAIAIIELDDGKANALSTEVIAALIEAVARGEREASAIVVAGRPDRFCAGFDLRVMMSSPDAAIALLTKGSELLLAMYECSAPLVIACTGHAVAGGALVVLTGDYRVGAAGAFKIGLNEVAIGLPVPLLAMEFARANLSKRALTEATLGAKIYDPDGALAAGYLDVVVPADQVLQRAVAEAARLGAMSRTAYQATKTRLRGATVRTIRDGMAEDMRTLLAR